MKPPDIRRPRKPLAPKLAREVRLTNGAMLAGTVIFWTAIAGVIARLVRAW